MQIIEKRKEEKKKKWIYTIVKLGCVSTLDKQIVCLFTSVSYCLVNFSSWVCPAQVVAVYGYSIVISVSGSFASLAIKGYTFVEVQLSVAGKLLMNEYAGGVICCKKHLFHRYTLPWLVSTLYDHSEPCLVILASSTSPEVDLSGWTWAVSPICRFLNSLPEHLVS